MKRIPTYISIFAVTVLFYAGELRGADDLPTKFSFDRYNSLVEHSPFAVATAVVAPDAAPNFAKDLYVANAAKSPDGDMVTIMSMTDKDFKKYLTTKGPMDGYGIANIEWSDKIAETKVTISKDGQFATLTFNEAELAKSTSNPRPPGLFPQLTPIQQPVFMPRPGAPNSFATPTPHVRGIIQRNPQVPTAPPLADR
jgi:hypothetical protein